MRDPSIHIRYSTLLHLLKEKGVSKPEEMTNYLFTNGYSHRLRGRYLVQGRTKAVRDKLSKKLSASTKAVEKFNLMLHQVRESKKHKFIKTIRTNDREYDILKEVAQSADDFVKLFEIKPKEEGYKTYAQIGIELMGKKYGLSKFKYYKAQIFEMQENYLVVEEDSDKESTKKYYEQWKVSMYSHSNMQIELQDKKSSDTSFLSKYVHIVFGRQEADSACADYKNWIEAQFNQLSWMNVIPELSQFYGENSKERYKKYMINKNKSDIKDVDTTLPTKHQSKEEKEYWEVLRNKRADK